MSDYKPFRTYQEQLELLKERKLKVEDDVVALEILRKINYYRLSAYSLTMRTQDPKTGKDIFYPGSTFGQLYDLYQFDDKFRQVILNYTLIIETNLKAYVAYYHSRQYGPGGYMLHENFEDPWRHAEWLVALRGSIKNRYKTEPFVKHHEDDLGRHYPMWVVTELCSFDQASKLYKNLLSADRAAIARDFFGIPSREFVESWVQAAVVARNIAAHGARFYNRMRFSPDVLLPNHIKHLRNKVFAAVYAIYKLLPEDKRLNFVADIQQAFSQHPYADIRYISFPENWVEVLSK